MLSIRPLSVELQKIAIDDLNENPDTMYNDVQHLRAWVQTQEHLNVKTDDQSLVNLLRGCKYNLELCKKKMETMCTMRTNLPEFFSNRDPFLSDIQELLNSGSTLPMVKTKSPGSPRVIINRIYSVDPFKFKTENAIKYALMIGDIIQNEDDNFIIGGTQTLGDFTGSSVHYLRLFDLGLAKSIYKLYNDAYTVTPRGSYAINVPKFAETLYNSFKFMLRSEHKDLIHLYSCSNPEELYEAIPLSILPEEYGGTGETIEELTAYWKQKVESYRDWFLEEEKYRLDKTKLPEKTKHRTGWFRNKSSSK